MTRLIKISFSIFGFACSFAYGSEYTSLLGSSLNQIRDCKVAYRCEASVSWGDHLVKAFEDTKPEIVNGKDVSKESKVKMAKEMVSLAANSKKDGLYQKNYSAAVEQGFKSLLSRLNDFSSDQQAEILNSFVDYFGSDASECKKNFVCMPVKLAEHIPDGVSCKAYKPVVDNLKVKANESGLFGEKKILANNYYESFKKINGDHFSTCSNASPSKSGKASNHSPRGVQ
ncbi:MAG: hypothetical protein B7Y39_09195 [Bdellovibrio sp. 28-41-41]|nr:MAG: hypothetical protein B7Y39_09195 [Bdellovibrio sp. 28-41-41]